MYMFIKNTNPIYICIYIYAYKYIQQDGLLCAIPKGILDYITPHDAPLNMPLLRYIFIWILTEYSKCNNMY
jgi:hypothetical protein